MPESESAQKVSIDESLPIIEVSVQAYTIPTEKPESDGTLEWNSTTLVVVEIAAANVRGLGYTYADTATAMLIRDRFTPLLQGRDLRQISKLWVDLNASVRNLGRDGIAAMAVSAVDVALWDAYAKCLDVPVSALLGITREEVPVYGSGGFTSYSIEELQRQLSGWVESGIRRVKMKVGRDPYADVSRVRAARKVIDHAQLFVDANGAYSRKQALAMAEHFAVEHVTWFEEPVYHYDFEGLHLLRNRAPANMEISAGEYGYEAKWFRNLIADGAVDVLQADVTRCGGFTGFLQADALCEAWFLPLSSHCAPTLHINVACAAKRLRHIEYFHDHVIIERMFFDGFQEPVDGKLRLQWDRPGIGLVFKKADAQRYAV